jgi:twinkle protein
MTFLSKAAERWFASRGIDAETVVRCGVFTGRSGESGVVPDERGDVIVFPFIQGGRVVAEKYRGREKKFWQRAGGQRTFWNADVLIDPALESGAQSLIVTEGEIDALTAIDCGFPLTVSVPDGAPAVPQERGATELDEIDPSQEAKGKFAFMFANRDRLAKIKRFILALDADPPGQRLAAEIVRRLGSGRCLHVSYPPEPLVDDGAGGKRPCKDLNEVRVHLGPEAVTRALNEARPYPVKGVYLLAEYPERPDPTTFSTGWEKLDEHLKPFLGELMVVIGVPSHGKSTWVSNMLLNMGQRYGLRAAVCSPEMPVMPFYRNALRRMLPGVPTAERDAIIGETFRFIDAEPEDAAEEITLGWVLERATDAVMRDGINALVIDPWNEIEHERLPGETQHEYVGRALRRLKRFARHREVMVILVVHPTKSIAIDGKVRVPNPYDAADSSHFFNKADHVVIVHRTDEAKNETTVRVAKSRFPDTGQRGSAVFNFNLQNLRFEEVSELAF